MHPCIKPIGSADIFLTAIESRACAMWYSEVRESGINIQVMLFVDICRRFRNKVRYPASIHQPRGLRRCVIGEM